jgi:hypothetical protein
MEVAARKQQAFDECQLMPLRDMSVDPQLGDKVQTVQINQPNLAYGFCTGIATPILA